MKEIETRFAQKYCPSKSQFSEKKKLVLLKMKDGQK
jgi:hypothetical protein